MNLFGITLNQSLNDCFRRTDRDCLFKRTDKGCSCREHRDETGGGEPRWTRYHKRITYDAFIESLSCVSNDTASLDSQMDIEVKGSKPTVTVSWDQKSEEEKENGSGKNQTLPLHHLFYRKGMIELLFWHLSCSCFVRFGCWYQKYPSFSFNGDPLPAWMEACLCLVFKSSHDCFCQGNRTSL